MLWDYHFRANTSRALISDLQSQAVENMRKLQRTTEELYTTNIKMLQRLQKVASSSNQLSFSDTASVTGSVRSVMSVYVVSLASFEHTLSRSRLYNRLHRNNQRASIFGQGIPQGWSILSGISLSEVSNIAVYRLDISLKYVYSSRRYTTLAPPSPLQRLSAYRNRDGQNERYQFLKETILEAVVNGPFDADKTLDGQVDMKTLDAVLAMFHDSRSQDHVVESLFDMNADGEVSDTFSKFSSYVACIEGWNDIVKLLLDNGANIESKDLHGWTPLMHTVVAGRTRTLHLLLDRGADIKSLDKSGRSALQLAAETHHSDIVKVLLERGAIVDEKDLSGRTALLRAAECGSPHVVKLLLERGASVEQKDLAGRSALHICAIARVVSTDVVRLLMEYGAVIDSRDSEGRTPPMLAMQSNVLWMYEKLTFIDGADVNARDDQGNTALHLLLSSGVERECKELIDALISFGAETTWENDEGKTAIQLTAERGFILDSNKLRHKISRIPAESISEL